MDKELFVERADSLLRSNILPFWIENMVDPQGGFYGRISGEGVLFADAPKGAVLNARILWTFAAAYRLYRDEKYLEMATRAKDYLLTNFYDHTYGGVYWSLTADGRPLDTKKQFYALGFAIYGLSEYYRATNDQTAIEYAIKLFDSIEQHSYNTRCGGYTEAATRRWDEIEDMRLSEKDANEKMSMNTHLHILEPYTNLYRVWKSPILQERIVNLINIFLSKIYDSQSHHLKLFFDEEWRSRDVGCSFGHDIEASWLIMEAAIEVGDQELVDKVTPVVRKIAEASTEGLQADGSMLYERHSNGAIDADRHWWVQAETVVGMVWLSTHHNDEQALRRAIAYFDYIDRNIVDHARGEWFWSRLSQGDVNYEDDKAGEWKCPYHNSRMCFEIMSELKSENN